MLTEMLASALICTVCLKILFQLYLEPFFVSEIVLLGGNSATQIWTETTDDKKDLTFANGLLLLHSALLCVGFNFNVLHKALNRKTYP